MSHEVNEASYQMDGVLHASSITVSFPAINPDNAFESLEVMQLFNSSRDGITIPGTYARSKAIQIIPWYLSTGYIAIAGRLHAYRTSSKLTPFGDDGYYVIT